MLRGMYLCMLVTIVPVAKVARERSEQSKGYYKERVCFLSEGLLFQFV